MFSIPVAGFTEKIEHGVRPEGVHPVGIGVVNTATRHSGERGKGGAAAQRGVYAGDDLIDLDRGVAVDVERCARADGQGVQGDVDAGDQLIDADGPVAVAITGTLR